VISRLLVVALAATFVPAAQVRSLEAGQEPASSHAQATSPAGAQKTPLGKAEIDDITRLLSLEDKRQFDEAELARMLRSSHPEVRRRAALAIGRIANARGATLLATARADKDPEVAATVVFATGQLKATSAIPWLSETLSSPETPPTIAREAATALGKFQAGEARAALTKYLLAASANPASAPVIGEALLSMGRFTRPGDVGPISRWSKATDPEIRWRAAWALARPRNPAAFSHLLRLSEDPSADVRMWAVRGLTPPPRATGAAADAKAPAKPGAKLAPMAPAAPAFDRAEASARLRSAVKDPDRRVQTEAIRALTQYDDDESFAILLAAIDSPDTWIAVSAIEGMGRFRKRADVIVPRLVAASGERQPLARRIAALAPLRALSDDEAVKLAAKLARHENQVAWVAARQTLGELGPPGQEELRDLRSQGVNAAAAARRAEPVPPPPARTDADYRRIVERWVVPDYNDAPKPRVEWETVRGKIQIELYAGDAPLGVDYLMHLMGTNQIVDTAFGRVVPNFVAQQLPIDTKVVIRDEVSRRGLTRGNVSWASSGLDTGRPGYTLANTPQPHNEGNFTALGRVVEGMDVVDRLELADRITAARILK
jgi:peptidylprolyl isomerase